MAPELLTVTVASVSCVAFCLVILMLVVVLCRKDPLCCRLIPYRTERYTGDTPHYHSRHSLIGIAHNEHSAAMNQGPIGPQVPGRLFIIGKSNNYHLNGTLPRLPKPQTPPPTYEETLRQALDISPVDLHSLDVPLTVHTQAHSSNLSEDTHSPSQPSTVLQGLSSSRCPPQSSRFLSI